MVSGVPFAALELAELFEKALDMQSTADLVFAQLEHDAWSAPRAMHNYILIDLMAWHKRHGRMEEARRLWDKACSVPTRHRDPRTWSRFYGWSFPENSTGVRNNAPDPDFGRPPDAHIDYTLGDHEVR
eukprot:6291513-Amphidinium_carterae.1